MIILLHADRNSPLHDVFGEKINTLLIEELRKYNRHISRLDVHLSDENGPKAGFMDKRCMIEAHIEGKNPIVVVQVANTHEESVTSTIDKLKNALETSPEFQTLFQLK